MKTYDITGNYIQTLMIEQYRRKYEKKNVYIYIYIYIYVCVYICMAGSLCCTAEINRTF